MGKLWGMLFAVVLIVAACGGQSTDTATDAVSDATDTEESALAEDAERTSADSTDADSADAQEEAETTTTVAETTTTKTTTTTTTIPPEPTMTLEVSGLEPLGDGGDYELWFVGGDGVPVSAGIFDTDAGAIELPLDNGIPGAVELKVSIETDDDPAPSDTIVLSGAIDGEAGERTADLAPDFADFSTASGQYILATPTDGTGEPANERAGLWWTLIPRAQSLFLPELSEGWEYEMWQVIDGQTLTGGKFTDPFAPDQAAPYSGPTEAPPLVGEDFLLNAPEGLTFPFDLRGTEVFISVEPVPDPSELSSGIVPLSGIVPDDAIDHTHYPVENVSDSRLPSATVTIDEG